MAALVLVGLLASAHAADARPPFQRVWKRCDHGQPCGELTSCVNGFCRPAKCRIDGMLYDPDDLNPANPCQACQPRGQEDNWKHWVDLPDGTTCPPPPTDDPCVTTFVALCLDGACVPELVSDGTSCGPDQVCCAGECCPGGLVCGGSGCTTPDDDDPGDEDPPTCDGTNCPASCVIDGVSYPDGYTSPELPCLMCDVASSASSWTERADGELCGSYGDEVCCNGFCCGVGMVCCSEGRSCGFSCP